MSYDSEFDDEPFGKRERKEHRPRTLAFVVVTMGLLSTCFIPILLCGQAPVAIPLPGDLPYNLIVNRETGQCLDVPYGATDPRVQVEQFPLNGGGNQLWRIEPLAGNSVRIINRHSGQCLDIPYGTSEAGTPVEQFPINGGSNQSWQLVPVGGHWYRIVNDCTGLCLEVPEGSMDRRVKIAQSMVSDGSHQHWRPIAIR
jgi:Ricin-type beta-trefoil lectin domain-like